MRHAKIDITRGINETFFEAVVTSVDGEKINFDIDAAGNFISLSEQEILEQIFTCDDDAREFVAAAVNAQLPVLLNDVPLSTKGLEAALATLIAPRR